MGFCRHFRDGDGLDLAEHIVPIRYCRIVVTESIVEFHQCLLRLRHFVQLRDVLELVVNRLVSHD